MSAQLPICITSYLEATNACDPQTVIATFTEDATVADESHEYRGHGEILEWYEKTTREYQPTLEVLGFTEAQGEVVTKVRVSGTFDGSPIELDFHFTLKDNRIASLSIVG